MPDFLSIPGNIRQQYMPFTVSGNGKTQLFSFKPLRKADRVAIIHPFSRWTESMIANDSGIKYTHAPGGSEKIEYNEFLDLIPSIQIREYVPDAKLTQMFKWFSYLKKGFDAGLRNIDNISFSASEVGNEVKKIMGKISKTMKELTSGDAKLLANVVAGLAHYYQDKGFNLGSDDGFAVLFLPFILYYRLTTTHTNNIYELPYSMENDIFQSDGTYGWGSSTGGADDFGLMKAGKAISDSPIGKLAQSIMGNSIKVNVMPSFQPDGEAKGDTINISFDLINDSAEAAINNFLFCHTLFGNNKWLQYGFVQAGSSVYDVKLPGANRYFMCSGEFKCKGKGVFRTPCETICQGLVNHNHATKTFAKDVINKPGSMLKQQMIDSQSRNLAEKYIQEREERSFRKRSIWNNVDNQITARFEFQLMTNSSSVDTSIPAGPRQDYIVGNRVLSNPIDVTNAYQSYNDTKQTYLTLESKKEDLENQVKLNNEKIEMAETEYEVANVNLSAAQKNRNEALFELDERRRAYELDPSYENGRLLDEARERASLMQDEFNQKSQIFDNAKEELDKTKEDGKRLEENIESTNDEMAKAEEQMNDYKEKLAIAMKSDATALIESKFSVEASKVDSTYVKDLIKIPDVYSITLTFHSLIPDNFNNYLYGFRAGNLDPIKDYFNGDVDEIGAFEKLVDQLQKAMGSNS